MTYLWHIYLSIVDFFFKNRLRYSQADISGNFKVLTQLNSDHTQFHDSDGSSKLKQYVRYTLPLSL